MNGKTVALAAIAIAVILTVVLAVSPTLSLWSETLQITGTAASGKFDAVFSKVTITATYGSVSSPPAQVEGTGSEKEVAAYDSDGDGTADTPRCYVKIEEAKKVKFEVGNLAPEAECKYELEIDNEGTLPWKIKDIAFSGDADVTCSITEEGKWVCTGTGKNTGATIELECPAGEVKAGAYITCTLVVHDAAYEEASESFTVTITVEQYVP